MKHIWILYALLLMGGAATAGASELPDIEWRVSAQFPQVRERVPFRGIRWRTPVTPGLNANLLESVLPSAGESWNDEATAMAWYQRVSRHGASPYAGAKANDAWIARLQRYDPAFLAYVRSDAVYVRVSAPSAVNIQHGCRWSMGGRDVGFRQGCRDAELLVPMAGAMITLLDGEQPVAESFVRPRRLVVLGLGDSYAAGEGNPDMPTQWSNRPVSRKTVDWLNLSQASPNSHVLAEAEWRDPVCHRSFWNQQGYVAMRLAADDPQREVDFLQFACSGAEILDGLLVRQLDPPGIATVDKSGCGRARLERCRVNASQLAAAVAALCEDLPASNDELYVPDRKNNDLIPLLESRIPIHGNTGWEKLSAYHHPKQTTTPFGLDLLQCRSRLKAPDLVLLSVGGNDAGFASLLAWALLPANGRVRATWPFMQIVRAATVICPAGKGGAGCTSPSAPTYAQQLPGRFALLGEALRETGLAPDPGKVVMSSYPDPLRIGHAGANGSYALCADDPREASPWEALNVGIPELMRKTGDWSFGLRNGGKGENAMAAAVMERSVLPDLYAGLSRSAAATGFTFVPATQKAFEGRTWCNEDAGERARLGLPSTAATAWEGGSPASWQPYAHRMRAIRTANDSYMTQLSTRSGDGNGTMHPTAEGHLLLALPVYEAVLSLESTTVGR